MRIVSGVNGLHPSGAILYSGRKYIAICIHCYILYNTSLNCG